MVHLEVTRREDEPSGSANRHGERVGDRVVDRDELEIERTDVEPLVVGHDLKVGLDFVFLELRFHERKRQT